MYCDGEDKQWSCGKAGTVNLQKVSSIMRDIGDPCLSQSPVKVVITVRLQHYWVFINSFRYPQSLILYFYLFIIAASI